MEPSDQEHASVKLYWQLAAVLSVLTFLEWVIFHIESVRAVAAIMVPALVVLSIGKFILVCGWYMHLRYDHNILRRTFIFSAFLATATYTILMLVV